MEIIRMITEASNAFNRVIQQAEEKIFDVERTEYDDEYIGNVKKMDILIHLTEVLIEETESMLEPNPAYRLEGKIMEKVDKKSDRTTPLENLGIAFDNASNDVKLYNYELYKDFSLCGKYQTKLGVASKEFQNEATDIYVSKLKKMLECELKKYKEEEELLENLRLDYDSLRIRIKKAITVSGKEGLERQFEVINVEFHRKLENNMSYFRGIDQYFDMHRELLKEFIESQSKYYMDCHSDLEKFKAKMESRILSCTSGQGSENEQGVKKPLKKFHVPKTIKVVTNESEEVSDNLEINASISIPSVVVSGNEEKDSQELDSDAANLNFSLSNKHDDEKESKELNGIHISLENGDCETNGGISLKVGISFEEQKVEEELAADVGIQENSCAGILGENDIEKSIEKSIEDVLPTIDIVEENKDKEGSEVKVDMEIPVEVDLVLGTKSEVELETKEIKEVEEAEETEKEESLPQIDLDIKIGNDKLEVNVSEETEKSTTEDVAEDASGKTQDTEEDTKKEEDSSNEDDNEEKKEENKQPEILDESEDKKESEKQDTKEDDQNGS